MVSVSAARVSAAVLFQRNDWPPQWRDGVYDFHHYHSTAHEVLGFAGGHATLMLGGENGRRLEAHAGDVAVLPTENGHCKLEAAPTFSSSVPTRRKQRWDICRSVPSKEAIDRMRHLPFSKSDPVAGGRRAADDHLAVALNPLQ
jgi:uncharacterized protein YjlB